MDIHHIHFYVDDAETLKDWFVHNLSFEAMGSAQSDQTHTEIVCLNRVCFLLSSPTQADSPVARYLRDHPPGVADVAFQVVDVRSTFNRAIAHGAVCITPIDSTSRPSGHMQWAQVSGWGDLTHTLMTLDPPSQPLASSLPHLSEIRLTTPDDGPMAQMLSKQGIQQVDHAVLNVATGDLEAAIGWYEQAFGFKRQQAFTIQTDRSALYSQVLTHPDGGIQFPVNEPASPSSQIQEFLDLNRGAGIQHVALATTDIVKTIAQMRQQAQICFLDVPPTYYEQLQNRLGFRAHQADWEAIARQGILVDWATDTPGALLLQIFTQPIFEQPTFFFEFIQRQVYRVNDTYCQAQGFGEGNFRALFEAIEREQMKRGGLQHDPTL